MHVREFEHMGLAYLTSLQVAAEAQGVCMRLVVLDRQSLAVVTRSVPLPWEDLRQASEADDSPCILARAAWHASAGLPTIASQIHDMGAKAMAMPRRQQLHSLCLMEHGQSGLYGIELLSNGEDAVRLAVLRYDSAGAGSAVIQLLSPWFPLRSIEAGDYASIAPAMAKPRMLNSSPVLENTKGSAFGRHDSAALSCPDFKVLGGMGLPVRLAAWRNPCFQHPAHPPRLRTQGGGSQSLIPEPVTMNRTYTRGLFTVSLPASGRPLSTVLLGAARRLVLRAALQGSIQWTTAIATMAKLDSLSPLPSSQPAMSDAERNALSQLEGAAA
ncbi:hypothetical protein ACS5PK_08280 [Roseateles sp. DB2]|uniref:hypothetical protein n=1 Tax=Roseateles sp. DB2 TaxID=3453717 RepID=UPI003EEBFC9A